MPYFARALLEGLRLSNNGRYFDTAKACCAAATLSKSASESSLKQHVRSQWNRSERWTRFHLATAQALGEAPALLVILTRDQRIRDNALALGYSVE